MNLVFNIKTSIETSLYWLNFDCLYIIIVNVKFNIFIKGGNVYDCAIAKPNKIYISII